MKIVPLSTLLLLSLLFYLSACGESSSDSPSGPLQNETNTTQVQSLNIGPDSSMCPEPLQADLPNTLYICDCKSGADSSCITGNDANSGTTNQPKQSLAAANSAISMGMDIAMCRGGYWSGSELSLLLSSNCSKSDPCLMQDYGDKTLALPVIENNSTDGTAAIFLDTHDNNTLVEGYVFANLHLKKIVADTASTGIALFRGISHTTMQCLEVENFGVGVQVNPNGTLSSDILLADSYIHNNTEDGFLGGNTNLTLLRNKFENNGYGLASALQHNVYIGGDGNWNTPFSNITIQQNHLIGSALDSNGQCNGTSLNVHGGVMNDTLIKNNLVEELNPGGGCWGIAADGITGTGDTHNRTTIQGNIIKNVGTNAVGISSCIDCTIENNLIIQELLGGALGIAVTNRPTYAPDANNTATVIRHNTIWYGENITGEGVYVGERGSNYVVTNNIVSFSTSNANNYCYRFDLPIGNYDLVSHNLCYGATFDVGTTGMDTSAINANPLFIDAPSSFKLESNSPALNTATKLSYSSRDIEGKTRDSSPDIGAYEY